MGILQKAAIYGVCVLGVIRYQHLPIAMIGLCSAAAVGTLASNYHLSIKSWEKSSEIIKKVTGYREDFNIKPDDYKRMEAEMMAIKKNLEAEINKDDELVNDWKTWWMMLLCILI